MLNGAGRMAAAADESVMAMSTSLRSVHSMPVVEPHMTSFTDPLCMLSTRISSLI